MKNGLTVLVIAAWLAMVTLLVRRQPTRTSALPVAELPFESTSDDAASGISSDEWFGIQQAGRKIGWAHHSTTRDPEGVTFRDDSSFTLVMLGSAQSMRTSIVARTDEAYALRSFAFRLISPAARFSARGTTDGKTLSVRYGAEGTESTLELPLTEPIHLPTTLRQRVIESHPADGARFTAGVFSPLTLRNEPVTLVVEGRETLERPEGPVEAWRIAEEHQGMRARAWLDPKGAVLREEAMLGFTLERATAMSAMAGIDSAAPLDMVTATRIPLTGEISNPREATQISLRVGGSAAHLIPDDPPRQRHVGDRLTIALEPVRTGLPAGLPPPGADDPGVAEHSLPSPFIESDDPAIVVAAREALGGEQDPVRAARRLLDWVSDHMTQEPSLTVPSAREVLKARRGDCNEHAVLLTALARAAGIPARVVAGAVYANDGFYYHAWSELWLGSWVSADAVFHQMPADATHVKLLEGGPERHLALAETIGQLELATMESGT